MKMLNFGILMITIISSYTVLSYDKEYLLSCNKYTCSPHNGKCSLDNKCLCANGYTTINDKKFGDFECNYKMKSQATTFLLELIIGFGMGHFYLGNVNLALCKLFFSVFACYFICMLPSFEKIRLTKMCAYYSQFIFGLIWVIWQIVDCVLILKNHYKDINGIEMRRW